jgi:2-hydroxy-3-keto-5-methylthiopentenyl-1-phosphate phosphatase
MIPIIRALLAHLLGPEAEDIEIVANDVADRPPKTKEQEGGWQIVFRDDSGFGHDKGLSIRPYADHISRMALGDQPTLLYAGDGISDLSAAREADLLFAKAGQGMPWLFSFIVHVS